jgi:hypothetical protein
MQTKFGGYNVKTFYGCNVSKPRTFLSSRIPSCFATSNSSLGIAIAKIAKNAQIKIDVVTARRRSILSEDQFL